MAERRKLPVTRTPAIEQLEEIGPLLKELQDATDFLYQVRDDLRVIAFEERHLAKSIVTAQGLPENQTSSLFNMLRKRGIDTRRGELGPVQERPLPQRLQTFPTEFARLRKAARAVLNTDLADHYYDDAATA